jgi:hypothetical protein
MFKKCGSLDVSLLWPLTETVLPLPYKKCMQFINAIYSSVEMGVFLMETARNKCGTIAVRRDKFGAVED